MFEFLTAPIIIVLLKRSSETNNEHALHAYLLFLELDLVTFLKASQQQLTTTNQKNAAKNKTHKS